MTDGMDITPLEWCRPPKPREPAGGYASRLAALNRIELWELASAYGLSAQAINAGHDTAVRAVARFAGLDHDQEGAMDRATPRLRGRLDAELSGQRLVHGGIHTRFFRYCPHCLAADLETGPSDIPVAARPWLRLEWLVEQVRSCPEHGVFMEQSNRTEPGQVLDFARTVSTEILPHLARLRSESVPASPNPFEDWVMRRLTSRDGAASWLDAMPVHAAISTCEDLGVSALHDAGVSMRRLTLKDWSDISMEGFRIASGGRESVDAFLTTLVGRARARGRVGLKETYGYLFLSLGRSVTDAAFMPPGTRSGCMRSPTFPWKPGSRCWARPWTGSACTPCSRQRWRPTQRGRP